MSEKKKPFGEVNSPTCQQLINSFPEPFVIIDKHFKILSANERYSEHYGFTGTDIIGRKCHEVSHHSSVPCSQHGEHCPLEEVFKTREAVQVMHIHYDQDNNEERVQISATPLFDESGKVQYMGETMSPVPATSERDLLIGRSGAILRMISMLQRVAPTKSTVLLLGESGVGKECVSEYIHHYSSCSKGPLVVVDCGTLGEQLIESELFGYVKGAFTGAAKNKRGLFEAANGGTLFIDEIGELPMELQTKLLRVLESGTIRPIGGTEYSKVDVRVVAATNKDLKKLIREGRFREDLYYRLAAFPINIPSLRERKDDIPALAEHFLKTIENGAPHIPLPPRVIETLLTYDYPGNVRELRNIIERAVILAAGETLTPQYFVFEHGPIVDERPLDTDPYMQPVRQHREQTSDTVNNRGLITRRGAIPDDQTVLAALNEAKGHRAEAAQALGVSERTLYRHLKKMRLDRN